MAEIAGKDASIANLTNSTHQNAWTIDSSADALEVTDFDVTKSREYISGLTDWSGSVECYADDSTDPPTVGTTISATDVEFHLNSTDYYSGDIIITGISMDVGVEDVISYSVEFQGTAGLSYTSA